MKHKLTSIFGFFAVFLLMAIGVESRAAGGPYAIYLPIVAHDSYLPPIIPATTKILPASTTQ